MPSGLPAYRPNYPRINKYQPNYPPADLHAYLPAYLPTLPTYLPPTYLHPCPITIAIRSNKIYVCIILDKCRSAKNCSKENGNNTKLPIHPPYDLTHTQNIRPKHARVLIVKRFWIQEKPLVGCLKPKRMTCYVPQVVL